MGLVPSDLDGAVSGMNFEPLSGFGNGTGAAMFEFVLGHNVGRAVRAFLIDSKANMGECFSAGGRRTRNESERIT